MLLPSPSLWFPPTHTCHSTNLLLPPAHRGPTPARPHPRPRPRSHSCAGKKLKGELVEPDQGLLSPEFEAQGYALSECFANVTHSSFDRP